MNSDDFSSEATFKDNNPNSLGSFFSTNLEPLSPSKLIHKEKPKHGLTTFEGALSIVSGNIGGGFVAIPYCFLKLGIPLGLTTLLIMNFFAEKSISYLLWAQKNIKTTRVESINEIGYILLGRQSIFIVGFIVFFNTFWISVFYFILFGSTVTQLVNNNNSVDDLAAGPTFY